MPKCKCGETDPSKFYGHKKTVCGKCHNAYTLEAGKRKRDYALKKLGGECSNCGFDKWSSSLDIHHTDPSIKDSKFGSFRGWSLERIDKELVSCVLLCKNCHSAFHAGHDISV